MLKQSMTPSRVSVPARPCPTSPTGIGGTHETVAALQALLPRSTADPSPSRDPHKKTAPKPEGTGAHALGDRARHEGNRHMSIKVMSVVWRLPVKPTEKLVMLALSEHADDRGRCWPSMRTLQEETSLSNRAVRYSIKRLEELGHLTTVNRNGHSLEFTLTLRQEVPDSPAKVAYLPRQHMPHTPAGHAGTPAPRAKTPATDADITVRTVNESKTKRESGSRRTRLPDDFELTAERKAYAEAKGLDAPRTFENFCDYWRGEGRTKCDWDATWHIWCRRDAESGSRSAAPKKTKFAETMEALGRA